MNIITWCIDSIFPPSAHESLVRNYTLEEFSALYKPLYFDEVVTLAPYLHKGVKAAVQVTKFEQSIAGAQRLGALVATHFAKISPTPTLLLPIPLSRTRERKRGFNQVTRVLEYACTNTPHLIVDSRLLYRTKDVVAQTTLNRAKRLENVKGIFAVNTQRLNRSIERHHIRRVIICDDVYTTGATLTEARTTLTPHLPYPLEIVCIAWTH